jgi:hypothetical protein
MFLEGGTRDHFFGWLRDTHPVLAEGYERLYARKYAPRAYRETVRATVAALRTKYGMDERRSPAGDDPIRQAAVRDAEQQMLRW